MSNIQSAKEVFLRALELDSEDERRAFLSDACNGDAELLQRVESLLDSHDAESQFLAVDEHSSDDNETPVVTRYPNSESEGDVIGRYKLLENIGEGGFGTVWAAEQKVPVKRRVALKLVKLGMDTKQVVARFEAERQALALMEHPNIAKVLDGGATESGRPFFVMELVRGIPITEYCDQQKLDTNQRVQLVVKLCSAIHHAHQKGIIHRDIKPSNILVTLHDGVPVPKVIDFGIAKATQQELTDKTIYTKFQQFIGTPAYISPEQAEMSGLDVDTRCDIYSLGVLLYELLTGTTPFASDELLASGLDEMRRIIRDKDPLRPSTKFSTLAEKVRTTAAERRSADPRQLSKAISGDLDWIVMKCLEKDRTRRYDTAVELSHDLARYLDDEPVVARPPTLRYRLQRSWKRNRLAISAAATVALALILGTAISTWQAIRATTASAEATDAKLFAEQEQRSAEAAKDQADDERRAAERFLYIANLNLAQEAYQRADHSRLRRLLRQTAAFEHKGFEWYYWQKLAHQARKTLLGHAEAVWGVAFSPDGQRVVSGVNDNVAKVWNVASGSKTLTLSGHTSTPQSVSFSPDGRRILTASWDGSIKVWNSHTGSELLSIEGHESGVPAAVFSPDGQRIVSAANDRTLRIWDALTGEQLLKIGEFRDWLWTVAFSPDGKRVATGGSGDPATVWDAFTGERQLTLEEHDGGVISVHFSPDGKRIVTGSTDHDAKVWNANTGNELFTLSGHDGYVRWATYSPHGKYIATASFDKTAKIWNAVDGTLLRTLVGHENNVWSVAFSPDEQLLATAGGDTTVKIWDVPEIQSSTLRHQEPVRCVSFSPDGTLAVSAGNDQTVIVHDVVSEQPLFQLEGHGSWIGAAVFSPDGQRILTTSWDHTARIWDAKTGSELRLFEQHESWVKAGCFLKDPNLVATGDGNGILKIWNDSTGECLHTFEAHRDAVFALDSSPTASQIVTASLDGTAKIWNTSDGHHALTLVGHTQPIRSVKFSCDGHRIVTGSEDGTARIWDASSGEQLLSVTDHQGWVRSAMLSPDGQRILTCGGGDGRKNTMQQTRIRVWDTASCGVTLTLAPQQTSGERDSWDGVATATMSPDGQRVACGLVDGSVMFLTAASPDKVRAWDEAERSPDVAVGFQPQRSNVTNAEPAPSDGLLMDWLVLAPFDLGGRMTDAVARANQGRQLFAEALLQPEVKPMAGHVVKLGASQLPWRKVQFENEVINFRQLVGYGRFESACLACYVHSDRDRSDLTLHVVALDDVYLNGKACHLGRALLATSSGPHQVKDLDVRAGSNLLLIRIKGGGNTENERPGIRLTDTHGRVPQGISVSLLPKHGD